MKLPSRLFIASLSLLFGSGIGAQSSGPRLGLSPGDQIRIIVWRKPELSGDFVVGANGTITHPLYKAVQVAGIPLNVVEDRLRTFLTQYETNPQLVVQSLVKIVVGGEVRSPNVFPVPPETTIAQAIMLAGGPTERGNIREVTVIREGQAVKMDLSRPDTDVSMLQIRSNDQVIVGRRSPGIGSYIGPVASSIAAAAAIISIFARP